MSSCKPYYLECAGTVLNLSDRTHIMGILNVTPDSFYDGGSHYEVNDAVDRAITMVEEGADIVDIGGESSRPGSDPVGVSEELRRVLPVIERLKKYISVPISIDTTKAAVAIEAIKAGASLVNDISGLRFDPGMASVIADSGVPVIVMHIKGNPKIMQKDPVYKDLIGEIYNSLEGSIKIAESAGVQKDKVVVDPGIGFGKRKPDNFLILQQLETFHNLGCPLLIGVSRKSFIGWALNIPEEERLIGTAAAVAACLMKGVHIVRIHDVKEIVQVARIIDLIRDAVEEHA